MIRNIVKETLLMLNLHVYLSQIMLILFLFFFCKYLLTSGQSCLFINGFLFFLFLQLEGVLE